MSEEGHQIGIITPGLLRSFTLHRTETEGLRFHLKVGFSIDVGGVDGDVAEPRPDGVDINAGAKKMRGGGVSDGVRSDLLLAHLRNAVHGGARISRHDVMNAEARQRLGTAIEEHSLLAAPAGDEISQGRGCRVPEWTDANLAALAVKAHGRQHAVRAAVQTEVFDAELGNFFRPRT